MYRRNKRINKENIVDKEDKYIVKKQMYRQEFIDKCKKYA